MQLSKIDLSILTKIWLCAQYCLEMETIIAPVSLEDICTEINNLSPDHHLISRGDFDVYLAKADDIPTLLREIGRLRELTFRATGEGTGKALDIDQFDQDYFNLFIWDRTNKKVVGGYRMGMGETIKTNKDLDRFYINCLFEIDSGAIPILQNSIELGRSYIVPEYQKGYLPFFLLWQGILKVLIQNKQYRYLIGPVSISKYYSGLSKSLIIAFVKRHFFDDKLASLFKPRTPFEPTIEPMNLENMVNEVKGTQLKDLECFINTLEPNHIKVPVLLKQYTKLNAKFISFNIDPNFSDALDGLMILDLKELPENILELLTNK